MKNLKWFDWLFIIITALLLLPVLFYAYGTLILGVMNWSNEQKGVIFNMAVIWVFITGFYILRFIK